MSDFENSTDENVSVCPVLTLHISSLCTDTTSVPDDEEACSRPVHTLMPHLQRAQLFLQRKEARLEQLRTQLQHPLPSFRPALCQRSRQLARTHSPLPRSVPECTAATFHPHINAKSRRLQRPGSVTERLYVHSRKPNSVSPVRHKPLSLNRSRELVRLKTDSKLQQVAEKFPSLLNYSQFRDILEQLNLVKSGEREVAYGLWKHLGDKESLPFTQLQEFLLSSDPLLRELRIQQLSRTKPVRLPESPPRRVVTPDQQRKQIERLTTTNSAKLQAARASREQEQLRDCTFTPQLVTTPAECMRRLAQTSRHAKLYKLAAVLQTRKLTVERPQLDSCSFVPKLIPRSASVMCELPKRAAETIARLKRAREEAAWREYRREHGLNNSSRTTQKKAEWRTRSHS